MSTIRSLTFSVLCLAVLGLAVPVRAASGGSGVWLNPSLSYTSSDEKDTPSLLSSNTAQKQTDMSIALNLGYRFDMGFFLGLNYSMTNGTIESTSGGTTSSLTTSYTGYGPAIGYVHAGGFYVVGSYLMGPTYSYTNSTGTLKLSGSTGMKFDIGYLFPVSSTVGIGPELVYETNGYKKADVAGTETDLATENKVTKMKFAVALGVQF